MAEVNRRYFDSLLLDKGLSLRALAQRMGMSHSQLSLTFNGHRKFQLEEAAQIASIFGQPIARVIEAAGVSVRDGHAVRVSVIGAMNGDGTVSMHPAGTIERTTAPPDLPENGVAVQARTAGTPLAWADGFVFFCAKPDGVDPAALGRFCLVQIKSGPAAMATVTRGYQERTYNLAGPFTLPNAALEWATPIAWTRN